MPSISTGRITVTEVQGARQGAIHRRVRGQADTVRLEPPAQLGFQMTGDGDHDRGGPMTGHRLDQRQLPLRLDGGLDQDDIVRLPGTRFHLGMRQTSGLNSQACRRPASPLREHQIVLDEEEATRHAARIAAR
jgi:hypothetical protein